MLSLIKLEVQGFGPFAEKQILNFDRAPGVTVIYGENMRGKTTLLNAIRYAFFGRVVGRGGHVRRLHTISNRALAVEGKFGFSVALSFDYDGENYEIVRECRPVKSEPMSDADYVEEVMVRRGVSALGPEEHKRILHQVFPYEISRFFLFDGELLQEYEELLINESDTGQKISESIERILGVPILKKGRIHLNQLSGEADKFAAREATKHSATQSLGTALQLATEQKEAHEKELARLQAELRVLGIKKADIEQALQSSQKYLTILNDLERATSRLGVLDKDESALHAEFKNTMSEAWRSLVGPEVVAARAAAQEEARREVDLLALQLRASAVATGHCVTCDQDVPESIRVRLKGTLPDADGDAALSKASQAMARLAGLSSFRDTDNAAVIRHLWRQLNDRKVERAALLDQVADYKAALSDSNPDALRQSRASFVDVVDKIHIVKVGIDQQGAKIRELDDNIQRLKKRLEAASTSGLRESQFRAKILRQSAEVFGAAVDKYKSHLRARVEETASRLFLSMTTETEDYGGLSINEAYGLSIKHRDGRSEEARSAGAEHVVALALMGALQHNAPLRGPIVMDSPFGRLDEIHTSNVIKTLPKMADQIILLVYEAEVGRNRMRNLLGGKLIREYELDRISSRRTNVRLVD